MAFTHLTGQMTDTGMDSRASECRVNSVTHLTSLGSVPFEFNKIDWSVMSNILREVTCFGHTVSSIRLFSGSQNTLS